MSRRWSPGVSSRRPHSRRRRVPRLNSTEVRHLILTKQGDALGPIHAETDTIGDPNKKFHPSFFLAFLVPAEESRPFETAKRDITKKFNTGKKKVVSRIDEGMHISVVRLGRIPENEAKSDISDVGKYLNTNYPKLQFTFSINKKDYFPVMKKGFVAYDVTASSKYPSKPTKKVPTFKTFAKNIWKYLNIHNNKRHGPESSPHVSIISFSKKDSTLQKDIANYVEGNRALKTTSTFSFSTDTLCLMESTKTHGKYQCIKECKI